MKTFLLLLLFQSLAFGQSIVGSTKLVLATNWVMLPTLECTNNCCRDRWPATMTWEGTIVTNRTLIVTNSGNEFTVDLETFPRTTAYTKPKRNVSFNVSIDPAPAIRVRATNAPVEIIIEE